MLSASTVVFKGAVRRQICCMSKLLNNLTWVKYVSCVIFIFVIGFFFFVCGLNLCHSGPPFIILLRKCWFSVWCFCVVFRLSSSMKMNEFFFYSTDSKLVIPQLFLMIVSQGYMIMLTTARVLAIGSTVEIIWSHVVSSEVWSTFFMFFYACNGEYVFQFHSFFCCEWLYELINIWRRQSVKIHKIECGEVLDYDWVWRPVWAFHYLIHLKLVSCFIATNWSWLLACNDVCICLYAWTIGLKSPYYIPLTSSICLFILLLFSYWLGAARVQECCFRFCYAVLYFILAEYNYK